MVLGKYYFFVTPRPAASEAGEKLLKPTKTISPIFHVNVLKQQLKKIMIMIIAQKKQRLKWQRMAVEKSMISHPGLMGQTGSNITDVVA